MWMQATLSLIESYIMCFTEFGRIIKVKGRFPKNGLKGPVCNIQKDVLA